MSIVTVCDCCGKVEGFIKFGRVVIKKGHEADGAYYDLCPECLEKVTNVVLELKNDSSKCSDPLRKKN